MQLSLSGALSYNALQTRFFKTLSWQFVTIVSFGELLAN